MESYIFAAIYIISALILVVIGLIIGLAIDLLKARPRIVDEARIYQEAKPRYMREIEEILSGAEWP